MAAFSEAEIDAMKGAQLRSKLSEEERLNRDNREEYQRDREDGSFYSGRDRRHERRSTQV